MQVDHIRNDFVQIPSSTSVQEGDSFSVAEGVNFGFSRTFDDAGPPPGTPVFFFQGILGRSRPEIGRLHRKCGRTLFSRSVSIIPFLAKQFGRHFVHPRNQLSAIHSPPSTSTMTTASLRATL